MSLRVSEFPSFQVSKFPSFQVSKSPSFQVTKLPSYQVSKFKSTIPRETGWRKKTFEKRCMQWHDTQQHINEHHDLETELAQGTVWKTIEEMTLRIFQPFRGLFNFPLFSTFIIDNESFNPS